MDSAASAHLQELILKRFPRMEEPAPKKWKELIDVDINFPSGTKRLKRVLEEEISDHARQTDERKLRRKPLEKRRSALLFGPPGTSKTSFARAIAGQLNWPLFIAMPPDFLSNGLEQIYVRATEIFDDAYGPVRCDLAVHLDINRGHISDIEQGKREVGIITLQVIARGLDTTMSKLLKDL